MSTTILIFFVAIVLAASAPVNEDAHASIDNYEYTNDGSGNYKFSYKTSNDLEREETGEVVNVGREDEHIVVRGFYSYIDVNGEVQRVMYTADENGYQPSTSIDSTTPGPILAVGLFGLPGNVIASLLGG